MTVVPIQAGEGSHLCTVSLYRMADGTIRAALEHMPVPVIESYPTITARFFAAGEWCFAAGVDLMRQGVRFDEEQRQAANDSEEDSQP